MRRKKPGDKDDKAQTPRKGPHIKGAKLKKLAEKDRRFVLEYLLDFNATQACLRSGYKGKSAGAEGHKLLKKPEIQQAIRDAVGRFLDDRESLLVRTIDEYKALAFSKLTDYISWDNQGNITIKASEDIDDRALLSLERKPITSDGQVIDHEVRIKLQDKIRGLEGLSRYLGIFQPEDKEPPEIHIHIDAQDEKL